MKHLFDSNSDALKQCCVNYEKGSVEQQLIIKSQNKQLKIQQQLIARLESVIINNVKNGQSFLRILK